MTCNMCGAQQLPEGTTICNYCGNQFMDGYYIQSQPRKSKLKWIIIISSIVAVIIAAIIITLVVVLSDSEENKRKTINGTLSIFFEAIEENNYEKYVSLVPGYWKNHLRTTFKSIMKSHIEDYADDFNCYNGKNRLFFEITDMKVLEGYEFRNIKNDLENWYDATGIEAYVELDITVRDINGEEWYF